MKSVNDNGNGSNNNWLGFSLSHNMKSDDPLHHFTHLTQPASSSPVQSSYFLSHPQLYHGVGQNGNFHSSLSAMPLKSDGSLCISEAINRSHTQGNIFSHFPCFLIFPCIFSILTCIFLIF